MARVWGGGGGRGEVYAGREGTGSGRLWAGAGNVVVLPCVTIYVTPSSSRRLREGDDQVTKAVGR